MNLPGKPRNQIFKPSDELSLADRPFEVSPSEPRNTRRRSAARRYGGDRWSTPSGELSMYELDGAS